MDLREILTKLSERDAPSGFEAPAATLASELLRPYVDDVHTDALGNTIGVKRFGKPDAKRLLIDAHIDEIGLIITGVEDSGFLRFAALGGVDARLLPSSRVKILTDPPTYGVVDVLPPHVLKGDDAEKVLKIDELYIDIGFTRECAEREIPLGTPAVPVTQTAALGEKLLCGKAFDDRACVAAIIRALELLGDTKLDVDLYVLFSSQEEPGIRGAGSAAYAINPDWAIIADVDFGSQPDCKPTQVRKIGGGVVISKGPNMDRALTDRAIDLAKTQNIPHQVSVEPGESGTNAEAIQLTRDGVWTLLFGIPIRYMHTPSETLDTDDAEACARLIRAAVLDIGGKND
jgi:endoglucanase